VELNAKALERAVAYFNTTWALPDRISPPPRSSLKQFLRELTRSVRANGRTVYSTMKSNLPAEMSIAARTRRLKAARKFSWAISLRLRLHGVLQHIGVPATDIGSEGHTAFITRF